MTTIVIGELFNITIKSTKTYIHDSLYLQGKVIVYINEFISRVLLPIEYKYICPPSFDALLFSKYGHMVT